MLSSYPLALWDPVASGDPVDRPSPEAVELQRILTARKAARVPTAPAPSWAELRVAAETFEQWAAEPDGVRYRDVTVDHGLTGIWEVPDGARTDAALLFTHGGGWALGSAASHRKLVGHLAKAASLPALNLDYRRSPENPHPGPTQDVLRAFEWLRGRGVDAQRVIFGGDSAGGALALGAAVALRDAGQALPGGIVLLGPLLDLTLSGATMSSNRDRDLRVFVSALERMRAAYLGDVPATDPVASPLHADLRGIPPIYLQAGEPELVADDARSLGRRAAECGVPIRVDIYPHMQHVFQGSVGNLPEADRAVAEMGRWISDLLAPR